MLFSKAMVNLLPLKVNGNHENYFHPNDKETKKNLSLEC